MPLFSENFEAFIILKYFESAIFSELILMNFFKLLDRLNELITSVAVILFVLFL